ncbi:hypothetical protein EMPG_15197 [Blastomyces silverae]|uniref:Uncharacterized protein n=1 Tax=Blastomyces silverae TaxID=2060906 RepID=A0A0H1BD73_9EURO|nr:hypothetical protein EMPG_15197 [Blastomyces silverae]
MDDVENQRLYKEESAKGDAGWGPKGRMTTYAGTGIGLVREVKSAEEIVKGVVTEARGILEGKENKKEQQKINQCHLQKAKNK